MTDPEPFPDSGPIIIGTCKKCKDGEPKHTRVYAETKLCSKCTKKKAADAKKGHRSSCICFDCSQKARAERKRRKNKARREELIAKSFMVKQDEIGEFFD